MENSINIREAHPDDFDAIKKLNRQIFEFELKHCEPTSNVDFPDQHDGKKYYLQLIHHLDGYVGFVAEFGNEVVGYAGVRMIPESETTHRVDVKLAQLHTLSVDEGCRDKGIGRKLIAHTKEYAKSQGANRMRVVAYAPNSRARHLYRSMEFEEVEIVHEASI